MSVFKNYILILPPSFVARRTLFDEMIVKLFNPGLELSDLLL
jgi:hypothetical protein